jgi:hypothetical protein
VLFRRRSLSASYRLASNCDLYVSALQVAGIIHFHVTIFRYLPFQSNYQINCQFLVIHNDIFFYICKTWNVYYSNNNTKNPSKLKMLHFWPLIFTHTHFIILSIYVLLWLLPFISLNTVLAIYVLSSVGLLWMTQLKISLCKLHMELRCKPLNVGRINKIT